MKLRRGAAAAAASLVLVLGPSASPARAQQDDDRGVILEEPPIIPEPNSGEAPEEAGDRGGALQYTILGAVVVGFGGGVAHLVRQSRRARSTTDQVS